MLRQLERAITAVSREISMLLKDITDKKLLFETKKLVKKEQEVIGRIITHLEEIEARKLYSDLLYDSIYSYCMYELGYSKDQAYRRISAMRLSKKLPEVKSKIERGTLNLSSANMLATLIKDTNMSKAEQKDTLKEIDGKNKKETTELLEKIRKDRGCESDKKRDHVKELGSENVRLSVTISKKTMDKIRRAKGLYGHQAKELDEILELMADALIEKYEEKLRPKRTSSKKETRGRYLSKEVKHTIYKRARGKCEICGGVNKLQYDHIRPHSRSGRNEQSNIRLLCQNCNLRQGVVQFGTLKMKRGELELSDSSGL